MNKILELTKKLKEFDYYDRFSVSPDGTLVAYVIRHKPAESHFVDLIAFNGTPFTSMGSELWLTNLMTGETNLVSGKNSWRPVWSPNSHSLAFYSDKNGFPQLWVYCVKELKLKLASEFKIKSSYSQQDKSCWHQNNKIIYFPADIKKENLTINRKQDFQPPVKVFKSPIYGNKMEETKLISDFCIANIMSTNLDTEKTELLVSHEHVSKPAFIKISTTGNFLSYISSLTPDDSPSNYISSLWVRSLNENANPQLIDVDIDVHAALRNLPFLWVNKQDKLIYIKKGKLYLTDLTNETPETKLILDSDKYYLSDKFLQINEGNKVIASIKTYDDHYVTSIIIIDIENNESPIVIDLNDYQKYTNIKSVIQFSEKLTIITQDNKTSETIALTFDNKMNDPIINNYSYCNFNHSVPINEHQLVSYYEDPHKSPNLVLLEEKLNIIKSLTNINPDIGPLPRYSLQVVSTPLTTTSGKKLVIRTSVLIPTVKPKAAIVYIYPGSIQSTHIGEFGAGLTSHVFPHLMYLEQGYAVILPDMPFDNSGVDNLLDEFTSLLIPQLENACQSLNLSMNNLGLIGHSFGGYSVAGIICKSPIFKAAVAISGIYDLGATYGYIHKHGNFFHRRYVEEGQGGMGHPPWQNIQRYIENSPYYLADKMSTPLLIVHGEIDATCPVVEAEKLFTALDRLGKTVELAIYQQEEHVLHEWKLENYTDAANRVLAHFNDFILSGSDTRIS